MNFPLTLSGGASTGANADITSLSRVTDLDSNTTHFYVGQNAPAQQDFYQGVPGKGQRHVLYGTTLNLQSQDANGNIGASGRKVEGSMDINTSHNAWVANTHYGVVNTGHDIVVNGNKTYSCITEGTSGNAGGPTGTGSNIVDGTVHWAFVGLNNGQMQDRMIRIGTMEETIDGSAVAAGHMFSESIWLGGDNVTDDSQLLRINCRIMGDAFWFGGADHVLQVDVNNQVGGAAHDLTIRAGTPHAGSGLGGGNLHLNAGAKDGAGTNGIVYLGEQGTSLFAITPNTTVGGTFAAATGDGNLAGTSGNLTLGNNSGTNTLHGSTWDQTGTWTQKGTFAFSGSGAFASSMNYSADDTYGVGSTTLRASFGHFASATGVVVHGDTTSTSYLQINRGTISGIQTGMLLKTSTEPLMLESGGNIWLQATGGTTLGLIAHTGSTGKLLDNNANNAIVLWKSTGELTLGYAAGKVGFFGATEVAKQSGTGNVTGFVAGSGTASKSDSVWAGSSGATAYTVGDLVTAMKNYGLLAA